MAIFEQLGGDQPDQIAAKRLEGHDVNAGETASLHDDAPAGQRANRRAQIRLVSDEQHRAVPVEIVGERRDRLEVEAETNLVTHLHGDAKRRAEDLCRLARADQGAGVDRVEAECPTP